MAFCIPTTANYFDAGTFANIYKLFVPSNFRRKGIGTKLLEEAENKIRECGVNSVNITYPKLNNMDWVQQWLERKGYSSINSFDSDTIHLHKRL